MIVETIQESHDVVFRLTYESSDRRSIAKSDRSRYGPVAQHDPQSSQPSHTPEFTSFQESCRFQLPIGYRLHETHPDLIGLAVLLSVLPMAGERILLSYPVSQSFHDVVLRLTGRRVLPILKKLPVRTPADSNRPFLMYSGGVDSTAALSLLPLDTVLLYNRRAERHDDPKSKYFSSDAALAAVSHFQQKHREAYVIQNDVEYLLEPTSLPTHQAQAVAGLLMADFLGVDSIAFGRYWRHPTDSPVEDSATPQKGVTS